MTFLPVVERELRVAARRRGTYIVRIATVIIALGLTGWVLAESNQAQWIGDELFVVLSFLLFIYAGFFGLFVTADCLSEEKREGTLGLLFLTDLKGYDVVFGKLTATSLNSFYGMLAVVPVLAIPLLMGGVSQGEVLRVVFMLVSLLFFSLSVGVWASALCRHTSRALAVSILTVLTILCAWPMATQLRQHPVADDRLAYLPSPVYGCILAFDANYKPGQRLDFWLNALITQLYGWLFLGMACWLVPRSWQDAVERKRSWWRLGKFTSAARAQLLAANPYLWRALRRPSKTMAVWLMLVCMSAFWVWLHWGKFKWLDPFIFNDQFYDASANFTRLILAGFAIKVWVAFESARALAQDRQSGAFELLLTTPIKPAEILQGQRQALWRQFAGPIGFLLAANLFFLVLELHHISGLNRSVDDYDWLEAIAGHAVIGIFLVLDSMALGALGMRYGFRTRKPVLAGGAALGWILALPVFLFCVAGYLILGSAQDGWSVLMFWCVLGLGTDLVAILSTDRLLSEFRLFVAEGHKRKPKKSPPFNATPAMAEIS
ncbi:MAG TPA: ABC transporter permease subunit [Verrucomicrobiae bacterium]|jgi:ABC-type Na+ efflux pump permease subunit